tara:strand:+ start:524 stop:631 length:108 start_codon:yes stop_codon:yes gene_type:complete
MIAWKKIPGKFLEKMPGNTLKKMTNYNKKAKINNK